MNDDDPQPTLSRTHPRNKSVSAWLALLGGAFGLHRFYLYGVRDVLAWLHLVPTGLGLWALMRVRQFGLDDTAAWWLPVFGLHLSGVALTAIVYGLRATHAWNTRHNPTSPADSAPGQTHWGTVIVIVLALMLGATAFMSSLAFGFQRYFEHQVAEGLKISQ